MNLMRSLILGAVTIVAIVLIMVFLNIAIKLAVFLALIAFAYYWFTRAADHRRRRRDW